MNDTGVVAPPRARITSTAKLTSSLNILGRIALTAGWVVSERVRRVTPTTERDIPVSADDITTEWLTAALCKRHPGARVLSFEIPGGSVGTSTRHGLRLTHNAAGVAAGLPTNLYTKTTTNLTQRLVLGLAGVIQSEPAFFNKVRPLLDIESPHGFHAAVDRVSWRSISLMEDISVTRGATFLHSDHTFDRRAVEDLLTNLAVLHGTMWEHPDVTASDTWMRTPHDLLMSIKTSINMQKRSAIGAGRARDVIPEGLMDKLPDVWTAFERSMEHASVGATTFLHGDAHVGNTYRTGAGRHGYTDWQMVMRGSWAFDVTLAIVSTLDVGDRRSWERSLLEFYLERLAIAGGQPPELDEAWDMYRMQALYPYHSWTYTIGRGALQPKMQPDSLCLPIIERSAAAVQDLDSVGVASRPIMG